MPRSAGSDEPAVELVELRVLDGPNRFFTRPAVKLEFRSATPGAAAEVAVTAAEAVRELHVALDMPAPRVTTRVSVDDARAIAAYVWRRRTISQAVGAAAARMALGRTSLRRELGGLRALALGPLPALPRPTIPIVAVTGTNGKSTTTRLIAHIAASAGMRVGMTNSDGIYVDGGLVEAGDWTGFGGAERVLRERGLDVAVLETARGGILLRGIGYAANDVSVVTNVSADHLGLQGIDTLRELAEVKGAIVRITKRDGWAVLNAEDPLVWAMRRETRSRLYATSLDPSVAAVGETLERGGRVATVEDGWLVLRGVRPRRVRLAPPDELPVTFAGVSRYNIANALSAAAACDALGVEHRQIADGLRSFSQDSASNPGRLNLFERDGVFALVDFAHNEAGLEGMLVVARAVAGRHGKVRLAYGTAGDRTDDILRAIARVAATGADDLAICEKPHYLRGRTLEEMNLIFRQAAREAGYRREIEALPTEAAALEVLLVRARPGDVCAVMSHAERQAVFDWLATQRYVPVGVERLRELVRSG